MKLIRVELLLTADEAEALIDAVESHQDCGTYPDGWQSDELKSLAAKVNGEVPPYARIEDAITFMAGGDRLRDVIANIRGETR